MNSEITKLIELNVIYENTAKLDNLLERKYYNLTLCKMKILLMSYLHEHNELQFIREVYIFEIIYNYLKN